MNPLYLYPAEANLLKSGKRGEAFREASKKLADVTNQYAGQSSDGKPKKLHLLAQVLAGVSIVLAALYVITEILLRVIPPSSGNAADDRGMHVVFLVLIAAPAVGCYLAREQVKDRILKHYLNDYEPLCEVYGEETLRQIGKVLRKEHVTATANYVCLRCRRGCRYDETLHSRDEMRCPVCGGDTLVGRITGNLFDVCCNYQAELDARIQR